MKNIHILPTDKPSRLWINNLLQGKLELSEEALPYNTAQNIYITSDEEIKEGNWLLIIDDFETYVHEHKGDNLPTTYHKKIILTTDQDLIEEGVQSIEDEFLEWFVKNPSCEEVEVTFNHRGINGVEALKTFGDYKIIIPKTTQQIIDEDFAGGLEIVQFIPKQEKIYTEEDVKNAFLDGWQLINGDLPFPKAKKSWFNKFKNK